MERLQALTSQLVTRNEVSATLGNARAPKAADDVVICAAYRTPLTKSKKGGLKDSPAEALLVPVYEHIVKATGIDPKLIQDIVIGNVLQSGAGIMTARIAQLMAGIPDTTPLVSVNRMCSSGIEAVSQIAAKIKTGIIDIGLAGGVEQMTINDMNNLVDAPNLWEAVYDHEKARNCLLGMGITSENVAQKFGISREKQDQMAVDSHAKAAAAQEKGLFKDEIVPVTVQVKDEKGNTKTITVSQDDGIRKGTTLESLGKLKPAFKKDGSTTAGNASQVTDGAALVLLAKRSVAEKLKLPIIARFVSYAVAGVPPEIMGIGPAYAIPVALEKAGLKKEDISIFELNEAFASQATYCIEKLGLDKSKVNPKGGAIALGHPLGCTGARQVATLLPELKRTGGKFGVISMCIGTGMGAAAVIERE
jgi:acetyl-CoA acyltransferase 1